MLSCCLRQVKGNTLDRTIGWRGEALYLWESNQQAGFTVCCLQSCPLSLLHGCSNPPDDGAGMVYIVCRGHAFSAQTGKNLCIPGGLAREVGNSLLCLSAFGIQLGRSWAELRFLSFSMWQGILFQNSSELGNGVRRTELARGVVATHVW